MGKEKLTSKKQDRGARRFFIKERKNRASREKAESHWEGCKIKKKAISRGSPYHQGAGRGEERQKNKNRNCITPDICLKPLQLYTSPPILDCTVTGHDKVFTPNS